MNSVQKLQKEKARLIAKWFKKGQNSIKRKNKSGCCCIINDDGSTIERLCDAHKDYVQELKDLMYEAQLDDNFIQDNDDFNERWKKARGD